VKTETQQTAALMQSGNGLRCNAASTRVAERSELECNGRLEEPVRKNQSRSSFPTLYGLSTWGLR